MGLAGAAVAYGDDVLPVLDVFAAGQLHHQSFVHRGDCREVEDVQDLHGRETGGPEPPLHHALAEVDELQFGEPEQVLRVVHSLGGAPGSHLPYSLRKLGSFSSFRWCSKSSVDLLLMPPSPAEVALTRTRGTWGYSSRSSRGGLPSSRHSTRCFTASKLIALSRLASWTADSTS